MEGWFGALFHRNKLEEIGLISMDGNCCQEDPLCISARLQAFKRRDQPLALNPIVDHFTASQEDSSVSIVGWKPALPLCHAKAGTQ